MVAEERRSVQPVWARWSLPCGAPRSRPVGGIDAAGAHGTVDVRVSHAPVDRLAVLSKTGLFEGFSREDLEPLAPAATVRTYSKRDLPRGRPGEGPLHCRGRSGQDRSDGTGVATKSCSPSSRQVRLLGGGVISGRRAGHVGAVDSSLRRPTPRTRHSSTVGGGCDSPKSRYVRWWLLLLALLGSRSRHSLFGRP